MFVYSNYYGIIKVFLKMGFLFSLSSFGELEVGLYKYKGLVK